MQIWDNEYPSPSECAPFYATYISLVERENIVSTLTDQRSKFSSFVEMIPDEKADFSYEQGKWTLKEVVGHMIETERLFAYRAFAISRGDKQALPGMDQDEYMNGNNYNSRTLTDLANEFLSVRVSTIHLFKTMTNQMIDQKGIASGAEITVRALAFIIAGHELHHMSIIKERYLKD